MIPVLLTKINKNTSEFIQGIVIKGENKSELVTISLAKALSIDLALPATPVESIEIYFYQTYKKTVLANIITVNELVCVDKEATMEYVKKFYCYKYYQSTTGMPFLYITQSAPIEDFFGISRSFSKEVLDTIRTNGPLLGTYVGKFRELLK